MGLQIWWAWESREDTNYRFGKWNTSKTSGSRPTLTIQAIYPDSLMLHLIALHLIALNLVALNLVALTLVLALALEPILQNARTGLH